MSIHSRGVSLFELLVCIAVLAIILCYGLSVSPLLYKKNQIDRVGLDIKNAIHFAQTKARNSSGILILHALSKDQDWSKGIGLYMSDGQLIYEWPWAISDLHVTWQGFQSNHYLRFASDMRESALNGTFIIHNGSQQALKLVLNRMGRVKVSRQNR